MYCLDANVWVYYLDAELEEHHAVEPVVDDLLGSEPLFTTTVLQTEVVHYVSNQLDHSEEVVDSFLQLEDVVVADLRAADVQRAATLLAEYPQSGIGGRDATVLAAMERYDVAELWTHDAGLRSVAADRDAVTVRDPVEGE